VKRHLTSSATSSIIIMMMHDAMMMIMTQDYRMRAHHSRRTVLERDTRDCVVVHNSTCVHVGQAALLAPRYEVLVSLPHCQ